MNWEKYYVKNQELSAEHEFELRAAFGDEFDRVVDLTPLFQAVADEKKAQDNGNKETE